ncbi:hypothetical protein [Agarivorans sp. DSG3-1]|uniref:hypothetical protein n=1 Tax=Agarivorans sp. DSG3-1 TaxID=3342249 RepID=UPI00398EB048
MKNLPSYTLKASAAILLMSAANLALAANKPGDDLPYFNAQRTTAQPSVEVADFTGKSQQQLATYLAEQPREQAPQNIINSFKVAVENNRKIAPEYTAMMEQQAVIRGVPVEQLFAEASMTDWAVNQKIIKSMQQQQTVKDMNGCTTVAFKNGIVGQTNDLAIAALSANTTIVKTDDVMFLPTDGAHFQGMGKHVGIVINFLGVTAGEDGLGRSNLVSTDAIFAAATGAKSIQDFITTIEGYTSITPLNFTLADDQGNHAAIRIHADGMELLSGNERGIGHANHTEQFKQTMLDNMGSFKANQAFFNTFAREQAVFTFLDYSPELSVESMQWLFNKKPINLSKYQGKDFVTVEAMVFDVKNGCAYVSGDNPRFTSYSKTCF